MRKTRKEERYSRKEEKTILVKVYDSPMGPILLGSIDQGLCLCNWRTAELHNQRIDQWLQRKLVATYREGTSALIETAQMQLEAYFAGERTDFNVPLLFTGSDFQLRVWHELLRIPYGTTLSYAELARRIGKPTAYRAVANANNANPLSIFIPCHRVIGSNHALTGYNGGLNVKQKLLELEAKQREDFFPLL